MLFFHLRFILQGYHYWYRWRHIDVQADWRSWTYGRAPTPYTFRRGFNVPVQAPKGGNLFTVIPRACPITVAIYDAHGDTEDLIEQSSLFIYFFDNGPDNSLGKSWEWHYGISNKYHSSRKPIRAIHAGYFMGETCRKLQCADGSPARLSFVNFSVPSCYRLVDERENNRRAKRHSVD